MKRILLIALLAGFSAGSYAQNKECTCKNRTAPKTATTTKVTKTRVVTRVPGQTSPTCFMDKKKNVGIPGCEDVVYGRSNTYTGNYPRKVATTKVTKPVVKVHPAAAKTDCETPKVAARAAAKPRATVVNVPRPPQPCFTYTQNNITVKQCPDRFYDNSRDPLIAAPVEYNAGKTWTGYYPENIKDPNLMENRPLEETTHFPSDNLSFWDSY